jgi:hypothetical protein
MMSATRTLPDPDLINRTLLSNHAAAAAAFNPPCSFFLLKRIGVQTEKPILWADWFCVKENLVHKFL